MADTHDDRTEHRRHPDPGGLADALSSALEQFRVLARQEPERVSGVRGTAEGWSVLADVVELERIPSTTSVLATYRVDIDAQGRLISYERLRRFVRGATDS